MSEDASERRRLRTRRALRVRRRLKQDSTRPRLSVVKTNKHLIVQLVDDEQGKTLFGVSTYSKGFKGTEFGRRNKASATKLGEKLAKLAKEHGIVEVAFDRGSGKYHGVVAAIADAAREGGLQF